MCKDRVVLDGSQPGHHAQISVSDSVSADWGGS